MSPSFSRSSSSTSTIGLPALRSSRISGMGEKGIFASLASRALLYALSPEGAPECSHGWSGGTPPRNPWKQKRRHLLRFPILPQRGRGALPTNSIEYVLLLKLDPVRLEQTHQLRLKVERLVMLRL